MAPHTDEDGLDVFLAVVRDRHPGVTLVLLPPETRPQRVATRTVLPADVSHLARRLDDDAVLLWREVVPDVEPTIDAHWASAADDALTRETLVASDEVDVPAGEAAVDRAELVWMRPGWSVLRPPHGRSRVVAAAEDGGCRAVVHVPSARRLALAVSSRAYLVEEGA